MEQKITRKRFFMLGGLAGAGIFLMRNIPGKVVRFFSTSKKPVVTINQYAVKRESRGKLHG
ncbi:MAG: hypothetical protein LWX56_00590 [Ignavibacteria bacterium]|nr:hypothetical protein [Ignavibacteria bacterium]